MKKLEGFRLDGIVQKMQCPFLLVHGAGDEQIPLAIAEKCFAAVGSKQKTAEGVHARGRRLPPLPGGQRDHRHELHVGLGGGCAEAGDVSVRYNSQLSPGCMVRKRSPARPALARAAASASVGASIASSVS